MILTDVVVQLLLRALGEGRRVKFFSVDYLSYINYNYIIIISTKYVKIMLKKSYILQRFIQNINKGRNRFRWTLQFSAFEEGFLLISVGLHSGICSRQMMDCIWLRILNHYFFYKAITSSVSKIKNNPILLKEKTNILISDPYVFLLMYDKSLPGDWLIWSKW